MPLPFFNGEKRRDQVAVVDLGSKVTKAVFISRSGASFSLDGFALLDSPAMEKGIQVELLAQHLKEISTRLDAKIKPVSLAIGVSDSMLRHAEMPLVPVPDMRQILKFSSKNYLQQDLSDCVFDCHLLLTRPDPTAKAELAKGSLKCRALVGAAKRTLVDDLQAAAKLAGLTADQIVPSFIGPPNAFELASPEIFERDVVALVDLGYRNSTISILNHGELSLSRVVNFGSAKLTSSIADTLGLSVEEAEGAKISLPPEVESILQNLLTPLGRELRASIDFHDHQRDQAVSRVYCSGGMARSAPIVQALQGELMVPCQAWNPVSFMTLVLPPQLMGEVEQVAPQLAVAVGAGLAAF